MKKISFFCALLSLTVVVHAQISSAKKTVKPVPKTTTPGVQLKTLEDSANYAMGLSVANFYKQQGVKKINSAIVTKAISDAMEGKQLLMNEMQANSCMMTYLNKQQMAKSKTNIDACESFMASNKSKPGVITTASGLQYEVLKQGTGPRPSASDTVTVNYKGSLLNGTVFDDSYSRGEPATFPLNRVIPGWTEGVQLMPVGSKYKFYIPYQLGYGIQGSEPTIPGGSLLIFEVDLLSIKGK